MQQSYWSTAGMAGKDQDKKKTLQNFRDYVREHYPWLKLLFVPAACTRLRPLPATDESRVSFSDVEFYALLRPLRGRSAEF